jgi:F0F1-type ATP synthase membrane subunit c/vacuolar-type H+-ATPase subunit K
MFGKGNQGRKRNPSQHQKQMRFFTGLFLFLAVALIVLIFWLVNMATYSNH